MRKRRRFGVPMTIVALALTGCSRRDTARETPPATPSPALPAECAPGGSGDWTGRYRAEEAVSAEHFAPQIMIYTADVFRDEGGRWRAFVAISGQTTNRALAACGVAAGRSLELRAVRPRSDNIAGFTANEKILTLERSEKNEHAMRIPDGSYLEGKPVVPATRGPLPPWAGRYAFERCPSAAEKTCWRYRIEVELTDEGWKAAVFADGPDTTERYHARGEDYEDVKEGQILGLSFLAYAPGDAHRGPDGKAEETLARLIRRGDGTVLLQLGRLPPGPSDATVAAAAAP